MNSIDKLTELFRKFPGIGPRQAQRFVHFLLSRNAEYTNELVRTLENLKREISQCSDCQKFFPARDSSEALCSICSDDTRDNTLLLVVHSDIDLESIEKSGSYKGKYFVLGGVLPILEKEPERRIRVKALDDLLGRNKDIKEIILAMNANADGENTSDFIKERYKGSPVTFSILGRGLSTGAEIEYADPETLKFALKNRTEK